MCSWSHWRAELLSLPGGCGDPGNHPHEDYGLLCERSESAFATTIDKALDRAWNRGGLVDFAAQHTWDNAANSVLGVFSQAVN